MHVVHTADVDADATPAYDPAGHAVHTDAPLATELYAPAAQLVHTADVEAATSGLYAPALHAEHTDVPLSSAL